MAKLDRLGWASGLSIVVYGVRVGIRVNRNEVLGQLYQYLPPGWKLSANPYVTRIYSLWLHKQDVPSRLRRYNLLYADAGLLSRTPAASTDPKSVFEQLQYDLQMYVARKTRQRLFVHAGVVGWNNCAILFPGASRSGKSTLVASLVSSGATYYSDEYAVLDAQGRVHPFPLPLTLRKSPFCESRLLNSQELGSGAGRRPIPIGLVIITNYRRGASWKPRRLSPGQGLLALLANTVSARERPKAALEVLQRVVSRAVIFKGRRGHAKKSAKEIIEKLQSMSEIMKGL